MEARGGNFNCAADDTGRRQEQAEYAAGVRAVCRGRK